MAAADRATQLEAIAKGKSSLDRNRARYLLAVDRIQQDHGGQALPLLAWFGYEPGAREPEALRTLTIASCLLPCALKLIAAAALHVLVIRGPQPAAMRPATHP